MTIARITRIPIKRGDLPSFFFEIEAQSFVVLVAPEVPNGGPPGGTSEIDGLNYRICGKLQLCGDLAGKKLGEKAEWRFSSKERKYSVCPFRANIFSTFCGN